MKIKNLLILASLVLLTTLFSAFRPAVENTPATNEGESFAEFLSQFEKVALPYEIVLDDFENYNHFKVAGKPQKVQKKSKLPQKKSDKLGKTIIDKNGFVHSPIQATKYIPEVSRGRFSRRGPPRMYPVARFYPNKNTVAVIFTNASNFSVRTHIEYKMMVYDLKGNFLNIPQPKKDEFFYDGNSFLMASTALDKTTTCKIDKEGRIWKKTYENVWKNDLKKKGYKKNQLLGFELKDTKVYDIKNNGAILPVKDILSDARAALY